MSSPTNSGTSCAGTPTKNHQPAAARRSAQGPPELRACADVAANGCSSLHARRCRRCSSDTRGRVDGAKPKRVGSGQQFVLLGDGDRGPLGSPITDLVLVGGGGVHHEGTGPLVGTAHLSNGASTSAGSGTCSSTTGDGISMTWGSATSARSDASSTGVAGGEIDQTDRSESIDHAQLGGLLAIAERRHDRQGSAAPRRRPSSRSRTRRPRDARRDRVCRPSSTERSPARSAPSTRSPWVRMAKVDAVVSPAKGTLPVAHRPAPARASTRRSARPSGVRRPAPAVPGGTRSDTAGLGP